MIDQLAKVLASCFTLSYIPAAIRPGSLRSGAGLIGTAFGCVTWLWVPLSAPGQSIAIVLGILLAVVVSQRAEKAFGRTDDPRIVIDEWIGVWIALAFLPRSLPVLIAAFVLFRIFDVWKPGPIKIVSKLPGGWGVVSDDVLAGVFANLIIRLAFAMHR